MATEPLLNSGRKIVVIGYGNPLRGDDAVGQRVALEFAALKLPAVEAIAVHQLTPELAERLASADVAIFVDARLSTDQCELAIQPLKPLYETRCDGHTSDPSGLLALTVAVYRRAPECWLVGVPAVDFSYGNAISSVAARGMAAARERIAMLIERALAQVSISDWRPGAQRADLARTMD